MSIIYTTNFYKQRCYIVMSDKEHPKKLLNISGNRNLNEENNYF